MSTEVVPPVPAVRARSGTGVIRIAFLGPDAWLAAACPPARTGRLSATLVALDRVRTPEAAVAQLAEGRPDVTVVLDPLRLPADALSALPGVTLGVLTGQPPDDSRARAALDRLDRVASFRPALTGIELGTKRAWRAFPPPVADLLFAPPRPLHRRPRAMTVGRSTEHREAMLLPAKHHYDLLQVIHGVTGDALVGLLADYDVGVYVAPEPGGGFGPQVGMHLAAGHLLLAETLAPAHGLERNLDYLHFDSSGDLVWVLERMARFPEMHQRIRIRGHFKAEQYRASRLWARIAHDLLVDVAAFGRSG